ncbi:NLP P60 protein [Lactobacillus selangorensis]|uniref:NLP P60 protein n=1 Tax=Lactobacillus selangorensis TaxID=81857 RepID=A0A0R2FI89_9LACO|nr:C40 family peptidase [Lactobacillus selangorensis]KRN28377.1 NLP P60 protein [Lactobacillus selangorensis]KRN31878.1 NLP P60 protein [Lactobacillus selangorensis]
MTFKKHLLTLAAAGFVGLSATALAQVNQTGHVSAATNVVTVSNPYGANLLNGQGHVIRALKPNSSWIAYETINRPDGSRWVNVGGDQWISTANVTTGSTAVESATTTKTTTTTAATTRAQKVQKLISVAEAQIGKPYVWGAKGPNSFDCSGFTQYVYQNALGKSIGGYTVAQESAGSIVAVNNLNAGDLIFWGARGATYHVAMYIGNNQYIAAPQPGENVKISSISSYFYPSFGVHFAF